MLLAALVDRRQAELSHPLQRERLIVSMTTLKKSMPLLSTSMQTFCKYPNNEQALVRLRIYTVKINSSYNFPIFL